MLEKELQPEQHLPDDFGAKIPNYEQLVKPIEPLLKLRRNTPLKRTRVDNNAVTTKTFLNDVHTRTHDIHGRRRMPMPLSSDEVLLRIAIFHPIHATKTQEFIVASSQKLTALRDRIYCLNDCILDGPSTPSGCFFIEGVFYDDMREQNAIRYSSTIIDWIRSERRFTHPGLSHYSVKDMESTTFRDLSVRVGAHYMYQHQGDCVHTMIVTGIRMCHNDDIQDLNAYPLRPFHARTIRRKCRVCQQYPASYVTYGDKLADEHPTFFCEECYRSLHYSEKGELLYNDFQVYAYEHE